MCECVHTYAHIHTHTYNDCMYLFGSWVEGPQWERRQKKAYILAPNMGLEFPSSTQESWKQQQKQQQKHSYGS